MEPKFWIDAWENGRTGFHKQNYHDKLLEFFPTLHAHEGESVLVPLCGKTKDMLWLGKTGLNVTGIELYQEAVEAFFHDNNLAPVSFHQTKDFKEYSHENIQIKCGNLFQFTGEKIFDYIYDRAALVALPRDMRVDYAKVMKRVLKDNGKYLLIVYEYDETQMSGPPFSVTHKEILELYGDEFSVKLLDSRPPAEDGPRINQVGGLLQNVYQLEKKRG